MGLRKWSKHLNSGKTRQTLHEDTKHQKCFGITILFEDMSQLIIFKTAFPNSMKNFGNHGALVTDLFLMMGMMVHMEQIYKTSQTCWEREKRDVGGWRDNMVKNNDIKYQKQVFPFMSALHIK